MACTVEHGGECYHNTDAMALAPVTLLATYIVLWFGEAEAELSVRNVTPFVSGLHFGPLAQHGSQFCECLSLARLSCWIVVSGQCHFE